MENGCRKCCGACRCGACCPARAELSGKEKDLLNRLEVLPILPLVREPRTGKVIILDVGAEIQADPAALESLERKGFVRVDEEKPVPHAGYSGYEGWIRGSVSLNAAGQDLLDILEYGGGFRDAGKDC